MRRFIFSGETIKHAGVFLQIAWYIFSSEKNQAPPYVFKKQCCWFVFEDVMRCIMFLEKKWKILACYLNKPANVFSSTKKQVPHYFCKKNKVPHYFFWQKSSASLFLKKKCWFFFEEILSEALYFFWRNNEASWPVTSIILIMMLFLQ